MKQGVLKVHWCHGSSTIAEQHNNAQQTRELQEVHASCFVQIQLVLFVLQMQLMVRCLVSPTGTSGNTLVLESARVVKWLKHAAKV